MNILDAQLLKSHFGNWRDGFEQDSNAVQSDFLNHIMASKDNTHVNMHERAIMQIYNCALRCFAIFAFLWPIQSSLRFI